MLETGIKGQQELTVTLDKCAGALGSGNLDVFATPAMIALMEETAWRSVQPFLQPGEGTVGTALIKKRFPQTRGIIHGPGQGYRDINTSYK